MFWNVFRPGNFSQKLIFYDEKTEKMKIFQISKFDISYFIFSIFVLSYPITWGSLGASAPRFGAQTRP